MASEQLGKATTLILKDRNTTARLEQFRTNVTFSIREAWFASHPYPGEPAGQSRWVSLDDETLLCLTRRRQAEVAGARDYLSGVSLATKKVVEPPPEKLSDLAKTVLEKYEINVASETDQTRAYDTCKTDLESYLATVYNEQGKAESIGVAVESLGVLLKIIEEAAKAALTEIDSARRAEAIRAFFKDPESKVQMQSAVTKVKEELYRASSINRHLAVKAYVDAMDLYREKTAGVSVARQCSAYMDLSPNQLAPDGDPGKPVHAKRSEFRKCFRNMWYDLEEPIKQVLAAAATYDIEADRVAEPAIADLERAIAKLDKLSDDDIDTDEAKSILASAIRLTKVVENLSKNMTSDETHQKVQEALKNLRGAL